MFIPFFEMELNWRNDDEPEEEDEEVSKFDTYEALRDGRILLIDATENMFKKLEGSEETPFQLCMKAARMSLLNAITSKDRDVISIVLYGTEKAKNTIDFKHIYVFQDLDQPGAQRILELENLLNLKYEDFKKEYGHSSQYSLAEALWTCSSIFSSCTLRLGEKKVILFTNNDDPHSGNQQFQRHAKEKAKDLKDLGIVIELVNLKMEGSTFDVATFYRDVLFLGDQELKNFPKTSNNLARLLVRVRTKDHRKRSMGRVNLILGENVKLAVSIYSLATIATKPYATKLYKKDNTELKTIVKRFLQDTGEILLPVDTKRFQTYAQRKIYMENDEVQQIKSFEEPGFKLLGFKPQSCLKSHLHIRSSLFIYPDESSISGSTTLFTSLLNTCAQKEKIAVCRFTPRRNMSPQIVSLLPQKEEKDETGLQTVPPGFHVIFQPFAEDIRKLNLDNRQDPPVELTEKAKEIVKKLLFDYKPDDFENPVLQTHWRNIEALALNRDECEEVIDGTIPDEKRISSAGHLLEEFNEMAFSEGGHIVSTKTKKAQATGPSAKRAKTDSGTEVANVKAAAEAGKLGSFTVSVLKAYCKSNNIKCGNKKAEVIEAINDFLDL